MTKRDHSTAMAFDFDGTLILGGKLNNDKSIHIMYSSWVGCYENGFEAFLRPGHVDWDTSRMLKAYVRYPGSPRFQQLAANVNALVNKVFTAFDDFDELGLDESYRQAYEGVRERYNALYSACNDAAAKAYWKPYPSVKTVLRDLHKQYDLWIASGVTQDILEEDFDRHKFDRKLFKGIYGGNLRGGSDKGEILKRIQREGGYDRVVFVADSNKDLEYAREAGVEFYRIKEDADHARQPEAVKRSLPRVRKWGFTQQELRFMKDKTVGLLERYVAGNAMTPEQVTRWINR